MNKVAPIIKAIFKKREDQNEILLKNLEKYEQKEKAKQQKSKVLGQKPVKRTTNKEKNADASRYQDELKQTKQELVDYTKPELTQKQAEAIETAVDQAVNEFDFSDTDNYEIDYSLDYDGRVQCESHEFIDSADLVEMIVSRVFNLFKEVKDDKTNN